MNMKTKISKRIIPGDKIIFIVDDNEVYAKTLESFILSRFPDITEVKIFSIGEMCLMDMHRNPGIVIMDYFLNSKFEEAHNGIEIIKRIKVEKPLTNIIVLSIQTDKNIVLEAITLFDCAYVQKDEEAFDKIEQSIIKIFNRDTTPPGPWN
jgi:two-component system OmpR family response regulator